MALRPSVPPSVRLTVRVPSVRPIGHPCYFICPPSISRSLTLSLSQAAKARTSRGFHFHGLAACLPRVPAILPSYLASFLAACVSKYVGKGGGGQANF